MSAFDLSNQRRYPCESVPAFASKKIRGFTDDLPSHEPVAEEAFGEQAVEADAARHRRLVDHHRAVVERAPRLGGAACGGDSEEGHGAGNLAQDVGEILRAH